MIENPKKIFLIYLAILSLTGAAIIYLATSRQGPGVSTDAAMMLSTSENLLNGRGLVDYRGFELTQFPPLYSMLLALGSLIFQQSAFVISWALAGLVFGAIVWFSGLYFFAAFEGSPLLAYFAAFIVFSSTSLIEISANTATDPLFLLMVVGFLFLTSAYLRTHNGRYLVAAGALTTLACFERYAGLSLVITGTLLLAVDGRKELRKAFLRAAAFAVGSALPIFVWGYLHNAPVNGTVFGGRQPADPLQNLMTGLEKILYWFIPFRVISVVGPVLLFVLILGVWVLLLFLIRELRVFQKLLAPQMLPSAIFLVVYGAVLIFNISTPELKDLAKDRVHIVVLPSLLIVGGGLFMPLLAALLRRLGRRPAYGLAVLFFLIWSAYPLSKSNEYLQKSIADGDASAYNGINRGPIRTSAMAQYLASRVAASQKPIYSNGSARAWFIMERQVEPLPQLQPDDRLNSLQRQYPHWPGTGHSAYVVWFRSEESKGLYATPEELQAVANLQQLYSDADGAVYLATAR